MKPEGKNNQAEEVEQKTNKREREHPSLISRVGQYALETPLGEGGHAQVWQARNPYGARVALKFIHPTHEQRAQGQARLLHEAEMYRASGAPRGLASLLEVEVSRWAQKPYKSPRVTTTPAHY
jgi:serine/threonine protein kinase